MEGSAWMEYLAKFKAERDARWKALGVWGRFKVRAARKGLLVIAYLESVWSALKGENVDPRDY